MEGKSQNKMWQQLSSHHQGRGNSAMGLRVFWTIIRLYLSWYGCFRLLSIWRHDASINLNTLFILISWLVNNPRLCFHFSCTWSIGIKCINQWDISIPLCVAIISHCELINWHSHLFSSVQLLWLISIQPPIVCTFRQNKASRSARTRDQNEAILNLPW